MAYSVTINKGIHGGNTVCERQRLMRPKAGTHSDSWEDNFKY